MALHSYKTVNREMKFIIFTVLISIVSCYGESHTCWGDSTDHLLYTQSVRASFEFFANARRVIDYDGVSNCAGS